ncbi:MAG: hypothetical protein WAZ77_02990, partial [Candidatus Nitrosopolaris sp.]
MIKLTLPLGAIIVVICVLPIPNAPAHFAKAGNCTSSAFSQLSNIGTGTLGGLSFFSYYLRKASSGDRRDAFQAGYTPATRLMNS